MIYNNSRICAAAVYGCCPFVLLCGVKGLLRISNAGRGGLCIEVVRHDGLCRKAVRAEAGPQERIWFEDGDQGVSQ